MHRRADAIRLWPVRWLQVANLPAGYSGKQLERKVNSVVLSACTHTAEFDAKRPVSGLIGITEFFGQRGKRSYAEVDIDASLRLGQDAIKACERGLFGTIGR